MLQDRLRTLQDDTRRSAIDEVQLAMPPEDGMADFVDWAFGILRRQYLVVLFVAALGVGAGLIYLAVATPIYTAQTNVYIDLHKKPIDSQAGIFGNDPIEIESQIQIIKSKGIASSVVKKILPIESSVSDSRNKTSFNFFEFLFGATQKPPVEPDRLEQMIESFQANLTVEPIGGRVVGIKYSSP